MCREAFNTLTECSTRLLDAGDYNAHSNTREQLQSDIGAERHPEATPADLDMFAEVDVRLVSFLAAQSWAQTLMLCPDWCKPAELVFPAV